MYRTPRQVVLFAILQTLIQPRLPLNTRNLSQKAQYFKISKCNSTMPRAMALSQSVVVTLDNIFTRHSRYVRRLNVRTLTTSTMLDEVTTISSDIVHETLLVGLTIVQLRASRQLVCQTDPRNLLCSVQPVALLR
jgi:hypothetical protein